RAPSRCTKPSLRFWKIAASPTRSKLWLMSGTRRVLMLSQVRCSSLAHSLSAEPFPDRFLGKPDPRVGTPLGDGGLAAKHVREGMQRSQGIDAVRADATGKDVLNGDWTRETHFT